MSANETMADIVAEMRRLSDTTQDGIISIKGNVIADRIEAAWKRERDVRQMRVCMGADARRREVSANGDIELICLKDKYDPCPFKRKRKDRRFYNCIKSYTTKYPPCEWVVYQPKEGRNEMSALL